MTIYWGSQEIGAGQLKLGSSDVTAVYWGATQIWPPAAPGLDGPRALENGTDIRASENGVDRRITEGGP